MESHLGSRSEYADFYRRLGTKIGLLCEAALKFDDLELVRFIKKYGKSPWFFHTGQAYKCFLYTVSMLDNQSSEQIIGNKIPLITFISLGMSPTYIKHQIEIGTDVNYKKKVKNKELL